MKFFYLVLSVVVCCLKLPLVGQEEVQSVQERYAQVLDAYEEKNWKEVVRVGKNVIRFFPFSPFAYDTMYFVGEAFFFLQEGELADRYLSGYLKNHPSPKHFLRVFEYKLAIAKNFDLGEKRHFLGIGKFPRVLSAKDRALALYEEIASTLPGHALAAEALFCKGNLLYSFGDEKEAMETYQTLIDHFPKSSMSAQAFLAISHIYEAKARRRMVEHDLLERMQIHVRQFEQHFPKDPNLEKTKRIMTLVEERFAKEWLTLAKFFEKTSKKRAAALYYQAVVHSFPDAACSRFAKERLQVLLP